MKSITLLVKPVSGLCNLNCKYCFYRDVSENRAVKSYGIMSEGTLEVLVKKALEYADNAASFGFQGGEPTLAGIEFYKKLVELQKKHNHKNIKITNSIQTNGVGLTEEFAKFLGGNRFLVGLSLDGPKEAHDSLRTQKNGEGTFNQVMRAARLLDEYGAEYNILCVVNNFNARHANRLYNFYKKNGFGFLQFVPLVEDFGDVKKDYYLNPSRYGEFLKSIFNQYYADFLSGNYVSVRIFDNYIRMLSGSAPEYCGMSGRCSYNLVVESDGSLYPCDFYVLDRYRLGNIHECSFDEIRENKIARAFVGESEYIHEKCHGCKWFFLCRGGCKRYREPFAGGRPSLNIYCESYRDFFEYAYERMCLMAQSLRSGAQGRATL